MAMVWIAQFRARSPPRLRRWRIVWPDEAGCGAVPLQRANAASLLKRGVADQEFGGADRTHAGLIQERRVELAHQPCDVVPIATSLFLEPAGALGEIA